MSKKSVDARLKLGEPLAAKLRDFCAANYNCAQIEVVREAIEAHIDRRLEYEPEMRRRYEGVRKSRLGASDTIAVLTPRKS
jgi:hypothetical protein